MIPFTVLCLSLHLGVLAQNEVSIKKATIAPVIDGLIDSDWTSAAQWELNHVIVGTAPFDLSAKAKALWDEIGLYILIEVSDVTPFDDSSDAIWRDDSFSVYLDGDNSKNTLEDGYDANDAEILARRSLVDGLTYINGFANYIANSDVAVMEVTGGYNVEIFFEWNGFPSFNAVPGSKFGFDIQVNDDVDGGTTTESVIKLFDAVGNGWGNPSVFGTGVLEGSTGLIWKGYTVDSNRFVNTEDWIGWLYLGLDSHWAYSFNLDTWLYFPDIESTGSDWAYVSK